MEMSMNNYKTACYCRLSQDDDNDGTSVSIETQTKVLADYCKAQGFDIYNIYTDDGYTGTNFERPGFRKMMSDIENNGVNLVVVKDLSRFGREHIMVDYYTQRYFPEHNVRFIAISDNVDISQHTLDRFDMMMPIKNVFNEFFPAETSMKVRQAFATKAKHGEYMGSTAPYGYKKSPDNAHALIKDEETAPIVKRIFEMAAYEGMGFQKIAYKLFDDRVMTPSALNDMRAGRLHEKNPYQWNLGTVKSIISNEVYLGTYIFGKRKKMSFKSDKYLKNAKENWIVNENMCEPIVSEQLWNDAQLRVQERKVSRTGELENIFAGLLKCEECGYSMRISSAKEKTTFFCCGNYKKPKRGEERCTCHYILYDTIYKEVLADINKIIAIQIHDREGFKDFVLEKLNRDCNVNREADKNEMKRLEESVETERHKYKQLYEDKFRGLISEEMFREMSAECEEKRSAYEVRLNELKGKMAAEEGNKRNAEEFSRLIDQHLTVQSLDKELLNKLIEKITVSEEKVDGKKRMTLRIFYKFVGDCTF
ncbi:MAG: recombinase family protein [Huintestinicola sp.]